MILKNKKKIRIIIGSLKVGGTEKQLLKIINNLVKKKLGNRINYFERKRDTSKIFK